MDLKVTLVIAGNYKEFLQWCRENKENAMDPFIRYARHEDQLRGLKVKEIKYCGTYWKNPVIQSYLLTELEMEIKKNERL